MMNPTKLDFGKVKYLIGTHPVELTKERQAALLDNGYIGFEVDYNLSDINEIIKVIYDRHEIDIPVTQFSDEPIATRIANFEKVYRQCQDIWRCKFDLVRVTRIGDLDVIRTEVIEEVIKWIKEINDPADTKGFARSILPAMLKGQSFDYESGTDSSIELINEHFYEIIERYKLGGNEIVDLAEYVSQREVEYVIKDESNVNIFNEALELEHQNINEVRKLNLFKAKTSGREYLK